MTAVIALLLSTPITAGLASTLDFTAQIVGGSYGVVYALDTGELDPGHDGVEVAVMGQNGAIYMVTPGVAPWPSEVLPVDVDPPSSINDRPTVAVGELIADATGEEVAVMASRHLNVVCRDGDGGWSVERIFDADGMVGNAWGARIGDYRPSRAGEEIFLIYEGVMDTSFGTVFHHDGDAWQDVIVYNAEVGMDSVAGEFDSAHAGTEFVVTTEMGPTYQLHEAAEPPPDWPKIMVWNDFENAGWVCEVGDVDSAHAGDEVVYGSRYSNSIMVSWPDGGGGHEFQVVFVGENAGGPLNIWDLAIGDLLPATPGLEIVGVDDSGKVYLVRKEGDAWVGETIWTDAMGAVHAVVVADFDPARPGDEILVGDAVGRLVLLTSTQSLIFADGFESGDTGTW